MMMKRHHVYVLTLVIGLIMALGAVNGSAADPEKAPLKGGEVSNER